MVRIDNCDITDSLVGYLSLDYVLLRMPAEKNFYVVLVGIDGSIPPNQILRNCMNAVRREVGYELDLEIDNVHIDIQSAKADQEQKSILGDRSIHVEQYDIGVDSSPDPEVVKSLVTEKLEDLGFSVTGAKIKEIDNKQFYYQ